MAAVLGASFTYFAILVKDSFWVFPIGTIAVCAFGFIVFGPYEIYKLRKLHQGQLQQLDDYINKGTVATYVIDAKRIAVAKEYEDEGDLFIVEYDRDKVLYLWGNENMPRQFPCLRFEVYEESFYHLTGKQVYSLSERIDALVIDNTAKWNYMNKVGCPAHLQTDHINFDTLLQQFSTYA